MASESDPGVSPQACAGGDEEESEEGGGNSAVHLLEALRQFRLHHRGQYRSVLEESLAAYHLRGDSTAEGGAGESRRTPGDGDEEDEGQEPPASPPSPPSPPPSPATAEPEASRDAPAPESDPSSD